jgi:hypothetical protein
MWDGQPSLGGVWVAHADTLGPVRVRITRDSNGASVEGWLFRSSAPVEGLELQISSEAALALGLEPNAPSSLSVQRLEAAEPGDPDD